MSTPGRWIPIVVVTLVLGAWLASRVASRARTLAVEEAIRSIGEDPPVSVAQPADGRDPAFWQSYYEAAPP